MPRSLLLSLTLLCTLASFTPAQPTREDKVRGDRKKVEAEGFWIYNDLPAAVAEAKKTNKPILAILRCIPCEECVKLDDDLVNQDKRVRPLLDQFVRVRIVSTNGLDLSLFQFDYDQSFAAFLLNADGTIYGRFGTRSHRTSWSDDVSIEGLAKTLQGTLDLHKDYPKNKDLFTAKKGPAAAFASPELYPSMKGKYTAKLDYAGKVVQSCIHCHQIGDAQRQLYRDRKEAIPDEVLYSYPHPKALGLILDPKERATVLRADKGSPADQAGFQAGDEILRLAGQPLLSIADVQWVLHHTPPKEATLAAEVRRAGKTVELTWRLPSDWRRRDDLSWRVSSWGLRRMAAGGMILEEMTDAERAKAGLSAGEMGLRVKNVGQFGAHAAAKNAGVQQGDVLVAFDERSDFRREQDVLVYAVQSRKPGERVTLTVLRGGKKVSLTLPMQP